MRKIRQPSPEQGTIGSSRHRNCDRDDPTNDKILSFLEKNRDAAATVAGETGLPENFILAWAAFESDWGTGSIAVRNNNFLGLTAPSGGTGGWPGAVACAPDALGGFACFPVQGGNNLLASAQAKLTAQNGRYLAPAIKAQDADPGNVRATAQAIADAGFNSEDFGDLGYGGKISSVHHSLLLRLPCLD
jgi:hypothetical protein